jgi:NADH-quinone oxidoreductase subunit C
MPDAPGLELIAQSINEVRDGTVLETSFEHDRAALIVDPEGAIEALRWLRDTEGQGYTFLSSVHAADYLPATPRFAVHYELLCRDRVERIRVKALLADPAGSNGGTRVAKETAPSPRMPAAEGEGMGADGEAVLPQIDSCVELFPTAEFQEREVYDFFGIVFRGHPDLRRILMPEDYVGWPQRRDFPIGGEPVLYTHNEVETPRWFE